MVWEAWLTLGVVVLTVLTLASGRFSPDVILLGAVTLLLTAGVIEPAEALAGLGNEGTVTVAVLFVVSAGLRQTGAMSTILHRILGRPKSLLGAQARIVVPAATLSAFMNNIPLVAMLLPSVSDWAKKRNFSPSKFLIPLSYASILGGMCTLIGTSTNLIVRGLFEEIQPNAGFGLFTIAKLGVPCAIVGLAYMLVFSRHLLKDRRPVMSKLENPREYTIEMLVEEGSPLTGRTIEQAGLRHLQGVYLMEIDRGGRVLTAVSPQEVLRTDDRLVFVGVVESVVDLQRIRGLKPATEQIFKLDAPRSRRNLVEAVVSDSCPLLGRTIRAGRFRTVYNAVVIAVARNGHRIRRKIGDIVLRSGDTLLLECDPDFVVNQRDARDFHLVSRIEGMAPPNPEKALMSLFVLVAMVVVAGLGWLSMLNAAMLAGGIMVLTRCCSWAMARRSVDWQLILTIAAALGLGTAMEKSGLANSIAETLLSTAGKDPWIALCVVYGLTMLFTELITNSAAAVIIFPIAMKAATDLQVSQLPFMAAIMMAASASFATPIGYQTNLMVYGPGGYRYSDYLRLGLPLNLILWALTVALAPRLWPF